MQWEAVISALLAISITIQFLIARANARIVNEGISYLDQNLVAALRSTLESLPLEQLQGAEPLNPFQQIIAEMIMQKINPSIQVQEIAKTSDGKFKTAKLDDF